MTPEAPRAAPDIWKRPNLPPGVSKDEKKIDCLEEHLCSERFLFRAVAMACPSTDHFKH
jgi:hypothetical protein